MRIAFFIAAALSLVGTKALAQQNTSQAQKLSTFYQYVQMAYVDEVDEEKVVEDAIKTMLEDLDPHSVYFSAEEIKKANEPLQGNFEGVGIQFNIVADTIVVVSTIPGGPSEKVGLKAGDKIVLINDSTVAGVGFTNRDVADHLRGKKGTKVNVSVKRRGESDLLTYRITRDKIPIFSVDAVYMADGDIGYLKLNRFAAKSMEEITRGVDSLQQNGMKHLILDLRGNGGGYLKTAIDLADMFLEKDDLIVYTQGRSYQRTNTFATSNGMFEKGKLVVLVDEGSASASEIVSGAVQDHDRALIIGRRSFGKGLVQKPFQLPDGSVIRLTVARYYTPSGRSIQRPYDNGKEAYYEDIYNRWDSGEMTDSMRTDFPDSLQFYTLKNQRTVYGGGGISPDIFVAVDTLGQTPYYRKLIRKGILNDFSLVYLDNNRKALLAEYSSASELINGFSVDDNLLNELTSYASENKLELNEEEYNESKELITLQLKALIARGCFGIGAFYQVVNQEDEAFNKAIEAINGRDFNELKLDYK